MFELPPPIWMPPKPAIIIPHVKPVPALLPGFCIPMVIGAGVAAGPAFVAASAVAVASGTETTIVVDKPAGTASGDVLLAFFTHDRASSRFSLAGWTSRGNATVGSTSGELLSKIAGGSEPSTYSFAISEPDLNKRGIVVAYRGGAVDVAGAYSISSSGASVTASALTASSAGTLVGLFGKVSGSTTVLTPPSDMTERANSPPAVGQGRMAVYDASQAAGSSGTKTITWSGTTGGEYGILIQLI
jgi:hypothetical protein